MSKKLAANLLIAALLLSFAIEAPPLVHPAQRALADAVGPALDAAGLGQGSWQLFAPLPKRLNAALRVEVALADGGSLEWRSPRWRRIPPWRKTFLVRHMKLYDLLGQESSAAAWPHFCRWALNELEPEIAERPLAGATLFREWTVTPVPSGERVPLARTLPRHAAELASCPLPPLPPVDPTTAAEPSR